MVEETSSSQEKPVEVDLDKVTDEYTAQQMTDVRELFEWLRSQMQ